MCGIIHLQKQSTHSLLSIIKNKQDVLATNKTTKLQDLWKDYASTSKEISKLEDKLKFLRFWVWLDRFSPACEALLIIRGPQLGKWDEEYTALTQTSAPVVEEEQATAPGVAYPESSFGQHLDLSTKINQLNDEVSSYSIQRLSRL